METSQTWIANVAILNKLLAKESWFNTFWAKFSGNVDISSDDNGNNVYRPSGNPIEMLSDFVAQGRDNMLIPFLKDLTGAPVYGDTVLKGTGEDQTMQWLRSYVNQYRKAVMKRSGQMSEQRQKLYKLYDEARPQLARWFTKWENQAVFQAFYEGVSPNLSTATGSDGLGIVKRYHPNWWYLSAADTLTAVGTDGNLKSAGELDTAAAAADNPFKMSAASLQNLRLKCMTKKIPQMSTAGGYPYWCLVMHPKQLLDLQQDTVYYGAQREAYSGKTLAMPEFSGAAGVYAGFMIYEDIVGIRAWDDAAGAKNFFGTTMATRFAATAGDNYNAIVFGKSAMGKGIAKDLHFTSEIDDHANTIEVGGAVINGYNRNEYYDEDDAKEESGDAFYKNQSSETVAASLTATNQSSLILMTG